MNFLLYANCRRPLRSGQYAQAKPDVFRHRHMPEQRIMLEDEPHSAFGNALIGHFRAVQKNASLIRSFQSGKNAQQRRLAATGWPQEGDELAGFDLKIDIVQDRERSEPFGDMFHMEP